MPAVTHLLEVKARLFFVVGRVLGDLPYMLRRLVQKLLKLRGPPGSPQLFGARLERSSYLILRAHGLRWRCWHDLLRHITGCRTTVWEVELRLRKESARVKDGKRPGITLPYEARYDRKDESTMLEIGLTRPFSVIIIFARS